MYYYHYFHNRILLFTSIIHMTFDLLQCIIMIMFIRIVLSFFLSVMNRIETRHRISSLASSINYGQSFAMSYIHKIQPASHFI
jgi:hypothetical protein